MANTLNTRISFRKDDLSNWNNADPILATGELAIVTLEDGSENLKFGNGISSFSLLSYLYQTELKSDKVTTKDITTKSIAQGYRASAAATSFAAGIFTEAEANFGVVHGIEAKIKEGDDYSYVFSGKNLPNIADRYVSHGEGTFNINPVNGISGVYIGEQRLADLLSSSGSEFDPTKYYLKSETSSASEITDELKKYLLSGDYIDEPTAKQISSLINQKVDNKVLAGDYNSTLSSILTLSVVDIDAIEYYMRAAEKTLDPTVVYMLCSDYVNAYGQRVIEVAEPVLSNDAATKNYVDNMMASADLSDYYKKSETSSAIEISTAISSAELVEIRDWEGEPSEVLIGEDILINQMVTTLSTNAHYWSKYNLVEKIPQLTSVGGTQVLCCNVDDSSINTIRVSADTYPVYVYLPSKYGDRVARDFCIRIECLTNSIPTVGFFCQGENVNFESEDDEWASLELGVNLFNFTETK